MAWQWSEVRRVQTQSPVRRERKLAVRACVHRSAEATRHARRERPGARRPARVVGGTPNARTRRRVGAPRHRYETIS
jgi:hypothetical protein